MTQLSAVALAIGLCRLAAGGARLLWPTRGFSRPTPESSMREAS
ncbi:hypothetical protein ACIHCV_35805 [Streptomyces sp. NPDC051956]